jgi:PBP1b-binding outer membrane lipoprotein LpoB
MKSFRLSILLVLALLSVFVFAGCVNQAAAPTTPTTPTTSVDADPVDELTASDDLTGISATELDDLQSDFDELDAEVSGVSETDI